MVDWSNVLPPSRPAYWQLEVARQLLHTCDRRTPVAVLGSTPEFRDLLAEMGFKSIYVFEKNLTFHRTIDRLRCYKNREQTVWGDWLRTLSDYHNTFCAILSDLTSGNLPYNERETLYRLVSHALRPGAAFVDKVLTHPIPHDKLVTLEQDFITLPVNLDTINRFSCKFFFCSELLETNLTVDTSLFYGILRRRFSHPRLRTLLKNAPIVTPSGGLWWYGAPWSKLKLSYFSHLRMLKRIDNSAGSPYAGRCRLYLSVRR